MRAKDPNVIAVERVANALGTLIDDLVLVGGCAVGLLITDQAGPPVRATNDVDLIAEVASVTEYYALAEQIRERGFQEDKDVLCRWRKDNLVVDVMPDEAKILGFSNRWYPLAITGGATHYELSNSPRIKVISAPLLVATKLESFNSRGEGDYAHHDMEDIVSLVDGRPELTREVNDSIPVVREFIRQEFDDLLADDNFVNQLPWHLRPDGASQGRSTLIVERLRTIAGL